MNRLCITTVSSADEFAGFIPLFVYSAAQAHPYADIKIWLCGKLTSYQRKALKLCGNAPYEIIEDAFPDWPQKESTCNALRHLVPMKKLKNCAYTFVSDLDFIFVKTHTPIDHYYGKIMERTGQPHAGARGPLTKRRAPQIPSKEWDGIYTRIAEGTFCFKTKEWGEVTKGARGYYREVLKEGGPDSLDTIPSCSYRDYGEVMLYRIMKMSGLKTPEKKNCFIDGTTADPHFRMIHVGDFKFEKRRGRMGKMKRILPARNVSEFLELEKDSTWQEICSIVERHNKRVKYLMGKMRAHMRKREAKL